MTEADGMVFKAVVATAGITLVVAGICFYFFYRYAMARQSENDKDITSFRREAVRDPHELFKPRSGTVKGVLVDEDGLEVLYLRRLEGGQLRICVSTVWINPMEEDEEEKRVNSGGDKPDRSSEQIQEIPLVHQSSNMVDLSKARKPAPVSVPRLQHPRDPQVEKPIPLPLIRPQACPLPPLVNMPPSPPPPPPPPPPALQKNKNLKPLGPPPPPTKITPKPPPPPALQTKINPKPPGPPPPPALPTKITPKPPPPPALPTKITPKPPPAPPIAARKYLAAPPPPFRKGVSAPRSKAPRGRSSWGEAHTEESSKRNGEEVQMKMRPFHWDKVNTNAADHSLVWNEINDGSLRFDDELMETLFGYNAAYQKSPEAKYVSSNSVSSNSASPAQVFILDPRKSQNTAIVLKSLTISHKEILDALLEGRGLNSDTLEKLTKISPNQEETSKILQFSGNPTKLAAGESFLYHILKAIPSAFIRINAMLFRSNYDPEILHLKESLQTLELGCKELRTRGIFLKLLEAILKAGNRMNAGTARGNAQGFNLSALRKLSYVKSTDGKTTLLHFVVEQVLRSEGKHRVINKNHRLGSTSQESSDQDSGSLAAKEEKDKDYIMLGLPILGSLSTEFSNVKKAAAIDYDNLMSTSPNLSVKVTEIRQLVTRCGNGERGGFMKEMKGFLEECEEELKVVREEQTRVMELVKRTTEFYQAGDSKEKGANPLQIFSFVKDFLDMVDQVCIDITKKLQTKKARSVGSSPPSSPTTRTSLMFQNLQLYFRPENPRSSFSSESEDDF